jgi:DNA-binding MarR family transcriptional regulator
METMTSTRKTAAHKTAKNKAAKAGQRRGRENGSVKFGLLPSYLGYQIRQAQTAIFRDLSTAISGLKVTPGEYGLLSLVEANSGISQVDLAQVYGLDKSTLSLAVSRLTERGLIQRKRSAKDGRYYTLQLLEPGKRLLLRVRSHVEAQERAMDAVLRSGERAQMLDMLTRISGVFSQKSNPA